MTMCTRHPAVPPQRRGLFATLLLAALCVIWGPASAQEEPQQQCAPISVLGKALADDFGEKLTFIGKAGKEKTLIVATFINRETLTFSIAVINPDGVACMVAAGADWAYIGKPAKPAAPSDAPS